MLLELARELPSERFKDLCARLASSPAFEQVWSDPRAYLWTRVAFGLADARLHGTEPSGSAKRTCAAYGTSPEAALSLHLDQIAAFALGAAHLSGEDWMLDEPLEVTLPFAIPATRFSLAGTGAAQIRGISGGRLHVAAHGEARAIPLADQMDALLRICPVARCRGFELPLHPHAFRVPGAEFAEPAVRAGLSFHERHASLAQETLEAMARYAPDSFATFRRIIRMAGLKPRDEGNYDDFSEPDLPGAFVASVVRNPLELADHFIHEMQHNRLQCIEESGPLFEGTAHEEPRYYSPWRDKLRGLYGIFHGVYVFVAVYRFWREVDRGGVGGPKERAYVRDRVLRLPVQLTLGVGVLERFAQLTPLGRAILLELAREVAEIRATASFPSDAPALRVKEDGTIEETGETVRESLLGHLRRNDVHGQCEGLLGKAVPSAAARERE